MGGSSYETESWGVLKSENNDGNGTQSMNMMTSTTGFHRENSDYDDLSFQKSNKLKTTKKNQVLLEGYVETDSDDDLKRTKSLTDDDLDELKGCLDLGFGFSYDEIPELCNTLPALELCYSMSQKFTDEHHNTSDSPIANWKISSPGDHPEDVKARLKFWAQAVACTVKFWRWTCVGEQCLRASPTNWRPLQVLEMGLNLSYKFFTISNSMVLIY
ncbi:hypothetical protein LWI28_024838 [Acer negundo]|uniref:Uncharacterized protein n=1 Tax=Acer negundo TaxID=4023 RepID=A0AAD5JF85_ACENE|nr:hypothetical protein LWI28_024838 [Acer negundo]KAK4855298.1 hypothetical protein QYF36_005790 [Acer negundo]